MIDNRSGMPIAWFRKAGPYGERFDVLAVRGTFTFSSHSESLSCVSHDAAILPGDEFAGDANAIPLRTVVRREGDLVIYKPAADVHVIGTARRVAAARRWPAGVAVGGVRKVVHLHGPREFRLGIWDWRLGRAEPTDAVELDYRAAFGGCFTAAVHGADDQSVFKPDNPAGCGWIPDGKSLSRLARATRRSIEDQLNAMVRMPAPQIEAIDAPVANPRQRLTAQGFGPVARWCHPRSQNLGTRDVSWRLTRYPAYPFDFNPRYFQSAHPDLICPGYLAGHEPVALVGMMASGNVRFRLPGRNVRVRAWRDDGTIEMAVPALDTLSIDLDRQRVSLTWRMAFGRNNPVRQLLVTSGLGEAARPTRTALAEAWS